MSQSRDNETVEFRRACENGSCVEAGVERVVKVRDSKDPAGPVLEFTMTEWWQFTRGVRAGLFDFA
jgi:hypothetical protein